MISSESTDIAACPPADPGAKSRLVTEVAEAEQLLKARQAELRQLREELQEFKALYARLIGSRLSELEGIEHAIKEGEKRVLGVESQSSIHEDAKIDPVQNTPRKTVSLKKLFWSVAKLFHPDHAVSGAEAQRRHTVMAEASRAYRDGDFESLVDLLGNRELQSFCTAGEQKEPGLSERLWALKDEIRTLEFGVKRIKQDPLYRVKASVEESASTGRDLLSEMTSELDRKIVKARWRLEHFS